MAKRRRNRRKNPNGGTSMRFWDPQQYEKAKVRNPRLFHPVAQLPELMLCWLKHHIISDAAYPGSRDTLSIIAGRHFGDGKTTWSHIKTAFGLFRFRVRDLSDRVNLINSILLSIAWILAALFGREGGFRYWCAIYESAHSGVKIDFQDGSEPVAIFKVVDPDDAPGWDEHFSDYPLWALNELENSIDEKKAARHWQQASNLPETAYPMIAMRAFLRLAHEYGEDEGDEASGSPFGDVQSSVAYEVAKANAQNLIATMDDESHGVVELRAAQQRTLFGPGAAVKLSSARAYGDSVLSRMGEELGRAPTYPLEGFDFDQLSRLVANQRYGAIRKGGVIHRGLDLPAKTGTPVLAMYGGEVIKVQDGIQQHEKQDGARGNYVMIATKFEGRDDVFLHEYYHLSDATVEVGKSVRAGDVIGKIGDTGNSHGPHLHLATRLSRWDDPMKRSTSRTTIDPEEVLRSSAVEASRDAGYSFGDPDRPDLAIPLYILQTVSGAGYSSPTPDRVLEGYAEMMRQERGTGDPDPDPDPSPGGSSSTEGNPDTKGELKKILVKIAPDAFGLGLNAALMVAGVDPKVAILASQVASDVIRSRQVGASGAPDREVVIADMRARGPKILGGLTIEEAGDPLRHIEQYIREHWETHMQ